MIRRIGALALGLTVTLTAAAALARGDTGDGAPASGDNAAQPAASGGAGAAAASAPAAEVSTSGAKNALGADVGVLIPIGDLADYTSLMIGGVVKYEMDVTPRIGVTGRVGFFYGLSKSTSVGGSSVSQGISVLPVWVGGRYYIMGGGEGLHAGLELGINELMARASGSVAGIDVSGSSSKTKFGFDIPIGYKIGDLDIQAQYSFLDVGAPDLDMAAGVTVGYNFLKF